MKHMLHRFMIILILFTLLRCGDSGSTDNNTTENTLEGTWEQTQFYHINDGVDDSVSTADDEWHKINLVYNGNTAIWTFDCNTGISRPTTSEFKIIWSTTFVKGDNVITPDDAIKIDYTTVSATATPLTASTVTSWNTSNEFGYNDWTINVSKNVLGRYGLPSNGDIFYDIFYLSTGELYIGDDEIDLSYDGSSDSKRPQIFQDALTLQ